MNNKYTSLKNLLKSSSATTRITVLGIILILAAQLSSHSSSIHLTPTIEVVHKASARSDNAVIDAFFDKENDSSAQIKEIVENQIKFVSSRKAYPASVQIVKNNEDTIRKKAQENNVPEELAIGIALLENGGSEKAISVAGAAGIFQLMRGTAQNLGLSVNRYNDERLDPEKNISAGLTYLRRNYNRFGDWGLATWAYHAGEGNVAKALTIYAHANHQIELPGIKDWSALKDYVIKHDVDIHKLLSDGHVQLFTKRLKDDSSGYAYKVLATAYLYELEKLASDNLD